MLSLFLVLSPLLFGVSHATTIYVRDGASGSGTSWTDAYDDISSAVSAASRGDTIYVADGSYAGFALDTPISGSVSISIKKATADDHGTPSGWSGAYGDGTALVNGQITIQSDYWDIDGQSGMLDGTFGIKIYQSGDSKCILIDNGVDHVQLTHLELEGAGYSDADLDNADALYITGSGGDPPHDIVVTRCWLHNCTRTAVWTWRTYDLTFDACWFTEIFCHDSEGVHGEAFSINNSVDNGTMNTIKNSVFRNIEGSGWIVWNNNFTAEHYDWAVYNNLFYVDGDHILDGWNAGIQPVVSDFTGSDGVVVALNVSAVDNIAVYGNTFANMQQSGMVRLVRSGVSATNTVARNNLMVHPSITATWSANTTSDNASETNTAIVTDYANFDLALASATNNGYNLPPPYDEDREGTVRGQDAVWDLGAYEYTGADISPPTISGTPSIGTNGMDVSVNFSETVVTVGYESGDLNLDCATAGTDIALSSPSGAGSSRTFTAATTIHAGDTCNLDGNPGADHIEDTAGNDMVPFSDIIVANGSTQASGDDASDGSGGGCYITGLLECKHAPINNRRTLFPSHFH
jgi:hypothetical protein